MRLRNIFAIGLAFFILCGCSTQPPESEPPVQPAAAPPVAPPPAKPAPAPAAPIAPVPPAPEPTPPAPVPVPPAPEPTPPAPVPAQPAAQPAAPTEPTAPAPAPAPEPVRVEHPAWKHEINITLIDDGWGCDMENARQVMFSAANEIFKNFPPERRIPRFEVKSKGGPLFIYAIDDDQHALIILNTGGTYWAQMAYQFAHEFCHNLCNYSGQNPQWWFSETLAETASRFALSRMAETWKTSPPYPNWTGYSGALQGYFNNLQSNERLPAGKTLAQWYRENAEALAKNSCDRPKNNVVAAELYEILNAHPEYWDAVSFYPRNPTDPDTFDEFLRVWRRNCPDKVKPFVEAIAEKFEVDLAVNPAQTPRSGG